MPRIIFEGEIDCQDYNGENFKHAIQEIIAPWLATLEKIKVRSKYDMPDETRDIDWKKGE